MTRNSAPPHRVRVRTLAALFILALAACGPTTVPASKPPAPAWTELARSDLIERATSRQEIEWAPWITVELANELRAIDVYRVEIQPHFCVDESGHVAWAAPISPAPVPEVDVRMLRIVRAWTFAEGERWCGTLHIPLTIDKYATTPHVDRRDF
jgi:hypothetical protein